MKFSILTALTIFAALASTKPCGKKGQKKLKSTDTNSSQTPTTTPDVSAGRGEGGTNGTSDTTYSTGGKNSGGSDNGGLIGYATMNGGTTGGAGGPTVRVSNIGELVSAVQGTEKKIVIVDGHLKGKGAAIRVGSNKSIIGATIGNKPSSLTNAGLLIRGHKNIIIQNLLIHFVIAPTDAIAINHATNIWIDHVDLSSDRDHKKDYYDGLLDITHAADWVTVSNSKIHDHWKGSLIGHSNKNEQEDKGHLTVTYYKNHFRNLNSRGPSFRFGTGHILNNYYDNVEMAINTRLGAQLLVEGNVFSECKKPIYATGGGYATLKDNILGGGKNGAQPGKLHSMPYKYTALSASAVKAAVLGKSGATMSNSGHK